MSDDTHVAHLGYSIHDDGVHVSCACGWDVNVGFGATPQDAMTEHQAHLDGIKGPQDGDMVRAVVEGEFYRYSAYPGHFMVGNAILPNGHPVELIR